MGYSPWGCKESDMTDEHTDFSEIFLVVTAEERMLLA